MGDTLLYRKPNGSTVEKTGCFKKVQDFKGQEGFVLTTFNQEEKYVFVEGEKDSEIHFSNALPVSISRDNYLKDSTKFLAGIKDGVVSKAVFSRVNEVSFSGNLRCLFFQLCDLYPDVFVYLISSELFGTWIGATPEVLLSVSNGIGETWSLAGTKKLEDSTEWSEKEIEEQGIVTEFIQNVLEDSNLNYEMSNRQEQEAGPVKHLVNKFTISGKINQEDIVQALHPTPAVCGLPRNEALKLIGSHEQHNRELYSGIIGLLGEENSSLFVNLRCAKFYPDKAFLFVGGGFTKDSEVEKEWEETEIKSKTLQSIMENL